MKYKLLLILLIFLFLINIVKADDELLLEPSTINIEAEVGVKKIVDLNITNSFDFDIYNIEFSNIDDIIFINIPILKAKQSVLSNFTIKTNGVYQTTKTSTVKFNYYSDIIAPPSSYEINITSHGFSPSYLNIKTHNQVTWINKDDIVHTVTSSIFDSGDILPNNSYSKMFDEVNYIYYRDMHIGFYGYLNVSSVITQELTYNSGYDKTLTLNINSKLIQTQLELNIIDDEFNLSYDDVSDGLLKIENVGNETAYNIILTSDSNWVSFDENNFNININQKEYVTFNLIPVITNINQTDKTHIIKIIVNSDNAPTIEGEIELYIQPSDIVGVNMSYEELRKEIIRLQQLLSMLNFPEAETQIIYKESEIPVNYTVSDVYAMKNDLAKITTDLTSIINQLKIALDNYNKLSLLYEGMNYSISNIEDVVHTTEKKSKSARNSTIIFVTLFFISGCVIVCGLFYRRHKLKKQIEESEKL